MEDQKSRDRRIRSVNRNNNPYRSDRIRRIKCVRDIIQDLECHGPAGLIHIDSLSDIIGKPIRIWDADGSLSRIIGEGEIEQAIDIEYHVTQSGSIGHWTLRNSRDPINTKIDLNSCLFSVIGYQTGHNPLRLRSWTVLKLKSNAQRLINRINEIIYLANNKKIRLMIGGACYRGTSPADAKIILDNSQGKRSQGSSKLGHARGHASNPGENRATYSVENYSFFKNDYKTGFLSEDDQDRMAHVVLSLKMVQEMMENMKGVGKLQRIDIFPMHIPEVRSGVMKLPKASEYKAREAIGGEKNIVYMVIVLGHHVNQHNNPNADVYVLTFYPVTFH